MVLQDFITLLTSKKMAKKKFVEMRRRKTTKKAFQLKCSKARSCNAILYISFKPPIRTMKNGSSYVLVSETTEEMLADLQNYDEVFHKHTKKCTNIDIDGVCRFVKHTDNCMFDKPQMLKRNYRIHLKEVVKQNPCSKSGEIIKISNSNFQLNVDENGQRQPLEYIDSLNIDLSNERQVISRNRIKPLQDEIPEDIRIIRHIDENATNGINQIISIPHLLFLVICKTNKKRILNIIVHCLSLILSYIF